MSSPEIHPRVLAELAQEKLNLLWPTLQEEMDMWNLLLADAADDPARRLRIEREAVRDLDDKWPFNGDTFFVSGSWHVPKLTVDTRSVEWSEPREREAFDIATSDGFVVDMVQGAYKVGLSFGVSEVAIGEALTRGYLNTYAFCNPGDISLTYIRPEAEVNDLILSRVAEAIHYYDGLLRLHLGSTSNFFRASHRKQKSFIDQLVGRANEIITSPSHTVFGMIDCKEAYSRADTSTPYGFNKIKPEEGGMLCFMGKIDGVTWLERDLLDQRPIRDMSDFINPQRGLCLIVTPADELSELEKTSAHIFVPYGEDIELELAAE